MKGKYGGPMPIDDFFQAFYQDRDFFKRNNITHVRAAYLYFTPCDQDGHPIAITGQSGNPIDGYISSGAYHCAAEDYDIGSLEPKTIASTTTPPPLRVFSP